MEQNEGGVVERELISSIVRQMAAVNRHPNVLAATEEDISLLLAAQSHIG